MRIEQENDIEILRRKALVLERENQRLSSKITELLGELISLRGEDAHQFELRLQELERELRVLNTQGPDSVTKPGSSEKLNRDKPPKKKMPQRGHGPSEQPQLEIVEETYDVDEADKVCTLCGGVLDEWEGQADESEMIDVIERRFVIRKTKRKKYRCQCGGCVETAIAPGPLVPGGRFSPEFVVESLAMKYLDNIPLNKQGTIFRREGLRIERHTLWDQHWAASTLLKPAWLGLKQYILAQPVIGADESPWPLVLKGGQTKWQQWALTHLRAMYIEIHPSKSAEAGSKVLEGYKGTVLADGAATYMAMSKALGFILVCCWAHARRKFIAAEQTETDRVREFLEMVAELFAIEKKAMPEQETGPPVPQPDYELLTRLRDIESRKVISRIQEWLMRQLTLPQGDLGVAIRYMGKRWLYLTRFLDDSRIPLTNNQTERGFLGPACGRRAYGGSRSLRGTIVAGQMYSLIGSAKMNGLEPKAYLATALKAALADRPIPLPHELIKEN